MDIAIIGAGMAGLSCGTKLQAAGHSVSVYDKGRGPGGRMATRRAEVAGQTLRFDHGAQYFTVKDRRFLQQVDEWKTKGVVARWPSAGDDAWVGTPGMNAPIKAMADKLDVQFGVRIESIRREGDAFWLIADGDTVGTSVDAVIVAVPAEQAGPLLVSDHAAFSEIAENSVSQPCWTVMAAFDAPLRCEDTLREAGAIGWAARNSAKPGRPDGADCWVIQGSPSWSERNLEQDKQAIADAVLKEFALQTGVDLPEPIHVDAHRWLYAMSASAGEGALWDAAAKIGVCGDWLVGPRVESAFVSGIELAERIIGNE